MKLRLTPRSMPCYPNCHRPLPSNTLYLRHRHGFLIGYSHLPGCQLRLTNPKHARQWCIFLLHLYLHTHWARTLLRFLPLQRNMKRGCNPPPACDNDRLCWLCPPLRTNVFLRCNCHHKPALCCSVRGRHTGSMDLGRLLRRQCHTDSLLCLPLLTSVHRSRYDRYSPGFPSRNWLK